MEEYDYGYIKIKLDDLLKDRGISKNKLAHRAEMQRTQINNYCNNEATRLDALFFIDSICIDHLWTRQSSLF